MSAKPTPVEAIRKYCLECTGNSYEWVRDCPSKRCALWPFRMKTNPNYGKEVRSESSVRQLKDKLLEDYLSKYPSMAADFRSEKKRVKKLKEELYAKYLEERAETIE